jgi:hypothetical protein
MIDDRRRTDTPPNPDREGGDDAGPQALKLPRNSRQGERELERIRELNGSVSTPLVDPAPAPLQCAAQRQG